MTDDHVPPQAIFAEPRPSNLVTVPACRGCNALAAKDDEYFRTVLALKHDTYDHPDVQSNLPAVYRALQRPANLKFARGFLERTAPVEARSPAGLYLGKRWAFDVDLTRLARVVERTVRGLYWHHHNEALPLTTRVKAWAEDGLRDMDAEAIEALGTSILIPLSSAPTHVIGMNVFEYRFRGDANCPHASAWLLQFYGAVRFLCLTVPSPPCES